MSADGLGRPRAGKAPLGLALVAALVLAACRPEAEPMMLGARPVRTVVAERNEAGTPITLTGRIEAEDEVSLAFRISGRILESDLKLGDNVQAGQLIARLESQNELNTLRTAKAHLAAAQGQLTQARNHFERQDTLLRQGWTTRANHGQAGSARSAGNTGRVQEGLCNAAEAVAAMATGISMPCITRKNVRIGE